MKLMPNLVGTQEMARLRQRLLAPKASAASTRLSNSAVSIACSPASTVIACSASHVHATLSLHVSGLPALLQILCN